MIELLKKYVIIILLAISLILITLPVWISSRIKMAIASPLTPLQRTTFQLGTTVNGYFQNIFSLWKKVDECQKLERKIFFLQNKVVEQQYIINKMNNELKNLTYFYESTSGGNTKEKPIVATVIGYDASDFRKSILIDAGSKHGIYTDNVVISDGALVGRISEVGRSSSRVQLITDPASRVPARVLETREQGIVEGTAGSASGGCRLKYIPRTGQVEKNNKVVSSGIGDIFPESIYIADVVESVIREDEPFRHVELLPRINPSKLEVVVVIRK
ncbi:MAG: rod shape-determining protein MreC [Planctomycetes bacterium]|nr:rod shape-determining protein MreC [Planctomycetota bacterium]